MNRFERRLMGSGTAGAEVFSVRQLRQGEQFVALASDGVFPGVLTVGDAIVAGGDEAALRYFVQADESHRMLVAVHDLLRLYFGAITRRDRPAFEGLLSELVEAGVTIAEHANKVAEGLATAAAEGTH